MRFSELNKIVETNINIELVEINTDSVLFLVFYTTEDNILVGESKYLTLKKGQTLVLKYLQHGEEI